MNKIVLMCVMSITLLCLCTLTGCMTAPNLETGEGFWRYGLRGEPTRPPSTDITYGSWDEIAIECGERVWGCYRWTDDKIFLVHGAGKVTLIHEQGHSMGMLKHNNCYPAAYTYGDNQAWCE